MSDYPSYEIYNKLYARYVYKRPVSELVDIAGDLNNNIVIDLCGGQGRLACYVAENFKADVTLVDQSIDMLPNEDDLPYGIKRVKSDIESFITNSVEKTFDVVFCRQAINYWFRNQAIEWLSKRMKKGGKFIFNTFMYKPSEKPMVKEYEYTSPQGTWNYAETSWIIGETVHHIQVCEGMEPHHTSFKFLDMHKTTETLKGTGFEVKIHPDKKTIIYECTKK